MKQDYIKLVQYVNKASELAESLRHDVQRGSKISSGTVVSLGHFFKAARAVQHLLTDVQNLSDEVQ